MTKFDGTRIGFTGRKHVTLKPYGKFNVVLFVDDAFDSLVSKHNTRQAAMKAAAQQRKAHSEFNAYRRFQGSGFGTDSRKHSYRVVTGGTLKNAFGLEVR